MKTHTSAGVAVLVTASLLLAGACSASTDDASESATTLSRAELNELDRKEALTEWSYAHTTDLVDFIVAAQGIERTSEYRSTGLAEECNNVNYSPEAVGAITSDQVPDAEHRAALTEAIDGLRDALEECARSAHPDIVLGTVDARADVLVKTLRAINVDAGVNEDG